MPCYSAVFVSPSSSLVAFEIVLVGLLTAVFATYFYDMTSGSTFRHLRKNKSSSSDTISQSA